MSGAIALCANKVLMGVSSKHVGQRLTTCRQNLGDSRLGDQLDALNPWRTSVGVRPWTSQMEAMTTCPIPPFRDSLHRQTKDRRLQDVHIHHWTSLTATTRTIFNLTLVMVISSISALTPNSTALIKSCTPATLKTSVPTPIVFTITLKLTPITTTLILMKTTPMTQASSLAIDCSTLITSNMMITLDTLPLLSEETPPTLIMQKYPRPSVNTLPFATPTSALSSWQRLKVQLTRQSRSCLMAFMSPFPPHPNPSQALNPWLGPFLPLRSVSMFALTTLLYITSCVRCVGTSTHLPNCTISRLPNVRLMAVTVYYSSQNDSLMAQQNVRQPRFSLLSPPTVRSAVGSSVQENMNNYSCGEKVLMTCLGEGPPKIGSPKASTPLLIHPFPLVASLMGGGGAISLLASNVYVVANGKGGILVRLTTVSLIYLV